MQLKITRHLWGYGKPPVEACHDFIRQGYDGLECGIPPEKSRPELLELLEQHNKIYVAQIGTAGNSVQEHLESFRAGINRALPLKPYLIITHSGRDAFSFDESAHFFREALQIAMYKCCMKHIAAGSCSIHGSPATC